MEKWKATDPNHLVFAIVRCLSAQQIAYFYISLLHLSFSSGTLLRIAVVKAALFPSQKTLLILIL